MLPGHGPSCCHRLKLATESEKGANTGKALSGPGGKSTDFLRASSSQRAFLPRLSKDAHSLGNNRKRKKDSNGRGKCRLAQLRTQQDTLSSFLASVFQLPSYGPTHLISPPAHLCQER